MSARWAEQYLTLTLLHIQAAVFLFYHFLKGAGGLKKLIGFSILGEANLKLELHDDYSAHWTLHLLIGSYARKASA